MNVPMTRPRLIAMDLDGTALDADGKIRPATSAAVRAAVGRGIDVVLVTGRHHGATLPFHHELGLQTPAICCNGTYVYDFAARRALLANPMSRDEAWRMLELCRRHGVHCLVYVDDVIAFETVNAHMRRFEIWTATLPADLRPQLRLVERFEEVIDGARQIWKFVVSHDDAAVLEGWMAAAAGDDYNVEASWYNRIDVTRAGSSKGRRLVEWAAARGVAPAEILAFGDNYNDLSMLTSVGLGMAMGNAEPAVKAAARQVIGSNESDAIGETIMAYIGVDPLAGLRAGPQE